ncbi:MULTISPECIES: MerR family transcriptional regulator [unclassified Microbacterium]|uniref:helix-turn-helix domain-containing protein n=1 Tax=unclassified Microbacterium TaxID=2609290 RepID=UPI0016034063|nr:MULTISPECIES: MerR family transcriptional regulator [unclassified Microbacterium]MBT2484671.1 MerR family transcriptional regulator [Microbacterium sp. ISL-108]
MNTSNDTLHSIGEVAHRTGLSVSAIRYYADEGLVRPTEATDAGHRLYDVDAIARLEFVRTLRDLETGLDQVRRVLVGTTSLRDVLAEHLDVIENRTTQLQSKRAVLRALVRQEGTAERANLLRKLVTMSDAERQRLVDDFLDDVSAGLPEEAIHRIREVQPVLPPDPSPEQLDAWISLAELLRDDQFREATRSYLHATYAQFPGSEISTPHVQEFIHSAGADLMPKLMAAHQAGFAADDTQAVSLAAQLVEDLAQTFGVAADDDLRSRLAARYRDLDSLTLEALQDAEYTSTEGRYLELVSIINDQPHPDAALLANARRKQSDGDGPSFGDFGEWLSGAILAAR